MCRALLCVLWFEECDVHGLGSSAGSFNFILFFDARQMQPDYSTGSLRGTNFRFLAI